MKQSTTRLTTTWLIMKCLIRKARSMYMKRWSVLCVLVLLFVLTACGGAGGNTPTSGQQSVQVNENDFKIASSVTTFSPGRTYHFVVMNNGQTAHEFMIMPKAEGSMSGMPMGNTDSMALAKVNTIAPGQTKSLDHTFPSSAAGSH